MNLQIYNEEKTQEPKIFLKLVRRLPGGKDISVVVVNENGDPVGGGSLVTFKSNGTLYRHVRVEGSLGFTELNGKIKEDDAL